MFAAAIQRRTRPVLAQTTFVQVESGRCGNHSRDPLKTCAGEDSGASMWYLQAPTARIYSTS